MASIDAVRLGFIPLEESEKEGESKVEKAVRFSGIDEFDIGFYGRTISALNAFTSRSTIQRELGAEYPYLILKKAKTLGFVSSSESVKVADVSHWIQCAFYIGKFLIVNQSVLATALPYGFKLNPELDDLSNAQAAIAYMGRIEKPELIEKAVAIPSDLQGRAEDKVIAFMGTSKEEQIKALSQLDCVGNTVFLWIARELTGKTESYLTRILDNWYEGVKDLSKLLNAQNSSGETILHLAIQNGWNSLAKKLIEKGANVTLKNHEGKKPSDYVDEGTNPEVFRLLLQKETGRSIPPLSDTRSSCIISWPF